MTTTTNKNRGRYGEITAEPGTAVIRKAGKPAVYARNDQGIYSVLAPRKDYPNAWALLEFRQIVAKLGIESCDFDRKGRGTAVNCDLYAYGMLPGTRKRCYIVQKRTYEKRSINGWPYMDKTYFILFREDGKLIMKRMSSGSKLRAAINRGMDNDSLVLIALAEVQA